VVLRDGQPALALGSGGANRIRSAIVQVLLNGLAGQMSLAQAVAAPRIHFEEGVMQVEAGHDPAAIDALAAAGYRINRWQTQHMYFGGVHAVARAGAGFDAVGDARRGGAAVVSEQ
jgi:gamma-glutamyltranspeptidase/glutathione hydrolase